MSYYQIKKGRRESKKKDQRLVEEINLCSEYELGKEHENGDA